MADGEDDKRKTRMGVAVPPVEEGGPTQSADEEWPAPQSEAAPIANPGEALAPPPSQAPIHAADESASGPDAIPQAMAVNTEAGQGGSARSWLPSRVDPEAEGELETLSGRFIWISLWRAFRLQIHTNEVLASERRTLAEDAQHIVDREQQAFLAWRRSVLLLVAICFVPLTVLRIMEAFDGPPVPTFARTFMLFPAIAEGIFCAVAFDQLKNWTRWKKQRRILFIAWSLYMLAPFILYLYPFRSAFEESIQMARQAAEIGGMKFRVNRNTVELVVGLVFGVQAQLVLAPKVVSLMPGLIRASIVSKLLFPGMTAPGWLMLLAAPLYALFAYIVVLLPYQITGQWYFVLGNAGLLAAQVFIAYSGRVLTVPLAEEEAHRRIHRNWLIYIILMGLSAVCIVYGLYDFITQLKLGVVRVISGVVSFVSNVLLLTLIGTDLIVSGMALFRRRALPDPEREALMRKSEEKLDRFSS